MNRQQYVMTNTDLRELINTCKPRPLIMLPLGIRATSQQEDANAAWARLGKRMGFDPLTALSDPEGDRFFTAVPL